MTKKLEEMFNLASADITSEESQQLINNNKELIKEVNVAIDKIDAALPFVRDLETADTELDNLAGLAEEKAKDLIDLGMNVDPRFAGVILQTASNMLGHAITAKTAKMDKKLRTIQLQLQKARLDHQISKDSGIDDTGAIEGKGILLDRNELLQQILNKKPDQK
jgi:hypothetical protein